MARHRYQSLVALSLTLGGFAACTFGADDFEIVPDDGSGGSGASSNAGSTNNLGGGDDVGGGETGPSAGSDGVAGAGLGGEPAVGGAGGAGNEPRFLCSPLGETLTVFTPADLDNVAIQGDPTVVAMGESVVIMVATERSATTNTSNLYYRPLSDSDSGTLDNIGTHAVSVNRLRIQAATADGEDIKIFGVADNNVFEMAITTGNGGRNFVGDALFSPLPTPVACNTGNGQTNGYLRDAAGSYDGDWTYAVTCGTQSQQQTDELYSLYVAMPGDATPTEVMPPEALAIDNIVRQYAKIGDTHVMLVGAEVGATIGVRTGSSINDLKAVQSMALSTDPLIFSSFLMRPLPDGIFLHGAAFTTDNTPNPPLIPAQIYDGSVNINQISDLFTTAQGDNAPPATLRHTATFTKASELVGTDDALPLPNYVLLAGTTVTPRNSIKVVFMTHDGTVLAPPTEVYKTTGATIGDKSVRVARLSIGFVVAWIEEGLVKARTITCLPD